MQVEYWLDVSLDVPMGSDLHMSLPVILYAPQPPQNQWIPAAPQGWNPTTMQAVQLNLGNVSVPQVTFGFNAPSMNRGF